MAQHILYAICMFFLLVCAINYSPHRARKEAADTYLDLSPSCEHKILHMSGFYAKKLGQEDASPDTLNLAKQQVGPPFYRAE